jgi:hypothetical protein
MWNKYNRLVGLIQIGATEYSEQEEDRSCNVVIVGLPEEKYSEFIVIIRSRHSWRGMYKYNKILVRIYQYQTVSGHPAASFQRVAKLGPAKPGKSE